MARPRKNETPEAPETAVDGEKMTGAMQALAEQGERVQLVDAEWGDSVPYQRDRLIDETRFYLKHAAESLLEAGRRMLLIKEHEPKGEFLEALDRIGIHPRSAQKAMQAALKYSAGARQKLEALGRTKMLDLMVEEDDDLDALAEGGTIAGLTLDEVDRMSVNELRAALRDSREQTKKAEDLRDRMLNDKDVKLNELDARLKARESLPDTEQAEDLIKSVIGTCVACVSVELARLPGLCEQVRDLFDGEVPPDIDDQLDQALVRVYRRVDELRMVCGSLEDVEPADHSWVASLNDSEAPE